MWVKCRYDEFVVWLEINVKNVVTCSTLEMSESSSENKLVSDEEWCKITWIEVVKNARYLVDCLWLSRLPKHDLCSSLRYLKKWFYWMRASILKLNLWNLVPLNLWLLFILFVLAHIQISFVYTIMLLYEHLIFFFYNFEYRELRDSIVILAGMLGTYLNVLVCMPLCLYVYALMLYPLKLVNRWSVVLISEHQTCRIYLLKCLLSFIPV